MIFFSFAYNEICDYIVSVCTYVGTVHTCIDTHQTAYGWAFMSMVIRTTKLTENLGYIVIIMRYA